MLISVLFVAAFLVARERIAREYMPQNSGVTTARRGKSWRRDTKVTVISAVTNQVRNGENPGLCKNADR